MRFLAFLLCLAIADAAVAADRRSDPNRLTIMTLNGEFLWDGRGNEEGQVSFPWKSDPNELTITRRI